MRYRIYQTTWCSGYVAKLKAEETYRSTYQDINKAHAHCAYLNETKKHRCNSWGVAVRCAWSYTEAIEPHKCRAVFEVREHAL